MTLQHLEVTNNGERLYKDVSSYRVLVQKDDTVLWSALIIMPQRPAAEMLIEA